jgi:hypothetical protein
VFGFDDYPATLDGAYLGTPPVTTTIRITDTQIEITGNWSNLEALYAIKCVEQRSGQRALWTGEHYTFPVAALPVVEDVFKHRMENPVTWIGDAVTRDTTQTTAVFLEYCGNCRSRQSKQQQRMGCKACFGTGLQRGHTGRNCPICQGNGAIAGFPDVEPYASGWWNGGWNIRFPEKVLRAYFGEPEVKFNGNFYEALLGAGDINKKYKQLARQYHPDVYSKGSQMFLKLREAYDVLRDPQRRKRYEAGLKFQLLTAQVQNDVVFEVPRKCGDLLVKGQYEDKGYKQTALYGSVSRNVIEDGRLLVVSEIINWNDRIDSQGRIMTSTWNPDARFSSRNGFSGEVPFTITWEQPPVEFVINV